MSQNRRPEDGGPAEDLSRKVERKAVRKARARRERDRSIWFGLGTFGVIGWSVAIPTLLGIALGIWLDATFPSPASWTLTFLFLGLALGCWNAWYWVIRERKSIEEGEMEEEERERKRE
jgi:ATP synthase protein I